MNASDQPRLVQERNDSMKNVSTISVFAAVASIILLAGCNNARIPDEGKVMQDADSNEYLVKFHFGNVYTIDPLPARAAIVLSKSKGYTEIPQNKEIGNWRSTSAGLVDSASKD